MLSNESFLRKYFNMLGKNGHSSTEISLFEECMDVSEIEREKQLMQFVEGKFIFCEGLPVDGVYYLIDGAAKLVRTDVQGNEKVLSFAKQGDCLGLGSLIDSTHFTASAVAIVHSACYFIPKFSILQQMESDPSVNIKIMGALCREIDALEEKIASLKHANVIKRVSEILLDLFRDYGTDNHRFLKIMPAWNDIANLANISTNTLARVFNDLKKEGLIAIHNKKIRISNPKQLEKFAKQF